jgi:penicillin-binding protein 1C
MLNHLRSPIFYRSLLSILLLTVAGSSLLAHWLLTDLPTPSQLTERLLTPSTHILARDGRELYEITDPAGANHTFVALAQIPLACQQATIATEDANFYQNPGVDLSGILRAVWINLQGGETLAGGSTITQQVARNTLLDPQERSQRTLRRKLRESILAWRLSTQYSKAQILELYLNQTYYGNLAYGLEAAATTYFGRGVTELSVGQCALLAGLPQAPALYDPLTQPSAALKRRSVVLGLMQKSGYLDAATMEQAQQEPVQLASASFPVQAPHFAFWVWQQLEQMFPPEVLYSGLTITTTLDLDLTRKAEDLIQQQLLRLGERDGGKAPLGGALVAIDPANGQILAMVGSPDYFDSSHSGAVNMAVAQRQPGSTLKPLTYAAAFDPALCGEWENPDAWWVVAPHCPWTPATVLLDVRSAFVTREGTSYVPQNYDRAFHGPVRVREALGGSLNIPAVQALDSLGLSQLLRIATRMGITTFGDSERYGLALTLGGGEVRLLDLTAVYATFAAGGLHLPPSFLLEVRSANGEILHAWQAPPSERVLDERVAWLISDILSDNSARLATFGPYSLLNIGRPAAVKTGTTTDFRDNWTMGYTPNLAVGVWVGNPNNDPMEGISGVEGAAPIWHDFMRVALQASPVQAFVQPTGIVQAEVCALSGLLPTEYCPHRVLESFIADTQPTQLDTFFQPFNIDTRNGSLAQADTPSEFVSQPVFLVLPDAAQSWGIAQGLPQPPTRAGNPTQSDISTLQITAPDDGTVFVLSPLVPRENQLIALRVVGQTTFSRVRFYLNDELLASVTQSPWQVLWQLQVGQWQLRVVAETAGGQEVQAQIQFVVKSE